MSRYINQETSTQASSAETGAGNARPAPAPVGNIWDAFNRARAQNINSQGNITNKEQLQLIDSKFDLLLKDTSSLKASLKQIEQQQGQQQMQIDRIFSLFNLCDSHIIDILSPRSGGLFSPDAAAAQNEAVRFHPFGSYQSIIHMSEEDLLPYDRQEPSDSSSLLSIPGNSFAHGTSAAGLTHSFAYLHTSPNPDLNPELALEDDYSRRQQQPTGPPIWSPNNDDIADDAAEGKGADRGSSAMMQGSVDAQDSIFDEDIFKT